MIRDSEYLNGKDAKARVANMVLDSILEVMLSPQRTLVNNQKEFVESLTALNDRIAQYNEGARDLARILLNKLVQDGESDD